MPIPPFQSKSTGAWRMILISSVGGGRECFRSERLPHLRSQLNPLGRPSKHPAARQTGEPGRRSPNWILAIRRAGDVRQSSTAGSGSGSTKMWRWSKAATSRICSESSIPLPNTSPDMSPIPTTVNGSVETSRPMARKCHFTDSHPPRAVIPNSLWSYPAEPPEAKASPSQ